MKKNVLASTRRPRKKSVAVVGIGRVGLPLALILASKGLTVYGLGRDKEKITKINDGVMPFLEKGAPTLLRQVRKKRFFATTDYSVISSCDFIVLTLGTPIDENMNPVFSQIEKAIGEMKRYIRKEQTLILRSTVSPRTTRYVKSLLNDVEGIKVGHNFFLAFCPERIAEGRALEEIATIPQMVGGVDEKSTIKAKELFRLLGVDTILTDDISAELAKLFTNMYRYINFAMANEFMVLADYYQRDIHTIVQLVNYGYTRGGVSLPGFTAGPCLFKDGFFMISELPFADLFLTSWKINESVPLFLVKKLRDATDLVNKKAVILGLAFKAEIDDVRASLSFKAKKALLRERMTVILHDPYVKDTQGQGLVPDVYDAVKHADVIFVGTNHKMYSSLDIPRIKRLVNKNCMVCDIWNVFGSGKILFPLEELTH
ncbi:MAG: nucleotide sugar dehydrogenase [bacterium]|nr:nucleotide sugar dehydrogenase [bacterium]